MTDSNNFPSKTLSYSTKVAVYATLNAKATNVITTHPKIDLLVFYKETFPPNVG